MQSNGPSSVAGDGEVLLVGVSRSFLSRSLMSAALNGSVDRGVMLGDCGDICKPSSIVSPLLATSKICRMIYIVIRGCHESEARAKEDSHG